MLLRRAEASVNSGCDCTLTDLRQMDSLVGITSACCVAVLLLDAFARRAGMWRDGILQPLQPTNTSNTTSNSSSASISNSSVIAGGAVYSLVQNPRVFASNFIPLWAGVAEGDMVQGARVVESITSSGLVGPAGRDYLLPLSLSLCCSHPGVAESLAACWFHKG